MKKLILTVAAVFAFGFANAQDAKESSEGFSKGSSFITGAFNVGSDKTGEDKSTGFTVAPSFGYFVTENIALGARIGYSSDKKEVANVDVTDSETLGFGVFGRYYVTPASKFSLFAELGVDYNSIENKLTDAKSKEIAVGVAPGVSYFLSNHFALEASFGLLGYSSNDNGGNGADKTNSFDLGLDLRDVSVGIVYKF
jgi:hypothetical protein